MNIKRMIALGGLLATLAHWTPSSGHMSDTCLEEIDGAIRFRAQVEAQLMVMDLCLELVSRSVLETYHACRLWISPRTLCKFNAQERGREDEHCNEELLYGPSITAPQSSGITGELSACKLDGMMP